MRNGVAADGHHVRTVTVDDASRTADVYLHIVLPEASWLHVPMLETYADRYSPGVRLRLEMGRYVMAEDYVRAMSLRARLTRAVDRALDGCDALLLPTLPIGAPLIGASTVDVDGRQEPVRGVMLRLTQLFNITGHPAISLPAGLTRGRLAGGRAAGRTQEPDRRAGGRRGSGRSEIRSVISRVFHDWERRLAAGGRAPSGQAVRMGTRLDRRSRGGTG